MPKKSVCDPLVKQYLDYCQASGRLSGRSLHQTRRVIGAFSQFLQAGGIGLADVGIEQVDALWSDTTAFTATGHVETERKMEKMMRSRL